MMHPHPWRMQTFLNLKVTPFLKFYEFLEYAKVLYEYVACKTIIGYGILSFLAHPDELSLHENDVVLVLNKKCEGN